MKIVLYVNSFLPGIGGREIVVHYLAREYYRMGHKVRVLGPSGWFAHRKLKMEYPVHRWPTLKGLFKDQVNYAQLRMDVGLWGADVIHAHTTFPSGYAAAQLKKTHRIPLVLTPHGEDIHMIPEIGYGQRLNPAMGHKIETAVQSAEILTSISDSVEASILDAGGYKKKIRGIENGTDLERFESEELPDVRRWLNISKDAPIILMVGNYRPIKGHEIALKAMPGILARHPEAHLVIVGRGTEKLQPLVDQLKINDQVRLTGAIAFPLGVLNPQGCSPEQKEDRLAALYCNSDIYVSASIDEGAEGLSLALMDAMAAGLPIVATKISGNKDLVKDGRTGLLVAPSDPDGLADAVIKVLKSASIKENMGREGYETVKPFHWRNIALRYLDVYHEAIEACR